MYINLIRGCDIIDFVNWFDEAGIDPVDPLLPSFLYSFYITLSLFLS